MFWLSLLVKAVSTALVVVSALAIAEISGPFLGGLIASLPISAGPAYVLLGLQHDNAFIAASALESFAVNAGNWLFLLMVIRLGPRARWPVVLGAALGTWLVAAALIRLVPWTAPRAILVNVVVLAVCLPFTRGGPAALAVRRPPRRWYDLPLRGALVATLVTTVVTLSHVLGPAYTGIGAVFPIALSSLTLLAMTRLGGTTTAALMQSVMRGLPGFALALLVVHLGAERFGAFPAMAAGLAVNLLWAAGLLGLRRRAPPLAPAPEAG